MRATKQLPSTIMHMKTNQTAAHGILSNLQHCAWPFLSSRTNVILSPWLFQEHFQTRFSTSCQICSILGSTLQSGHCLAHLRAVWACSTKCRECVFWQRIRWWQQWWGDPWHLQVCRAARTLFYIHMQKINDLCSYKTSYCLQWTGSTSKSDLPGNVATLTLW